MWLIENPEGLEDSEILIVSCSFEQDSCIIVAHAAILLLLGLLGLPISLLLIGEPTGHT